MRIGILETGFPPRDQQDRHGRYSDMFMRLLSGHGFDFAAWRAPLGEIPQDPHEAEGWLITGSRYGVYDDEDWIRGSEAFVKTALAAKVPTVGICFGHQLMAQAAGGRVVKSDKGWGLGPTDYEDASDEGDGAMTLIAMHQDQVVEKPAGARIIARTDFCPIAGLEWEDAPAVSWQPHPEFEPGFTRALIEARRGDLYAEPLADAALARLSEPLDSQRLGDRIARFFVEQGRRAAA